MIGHPRDYETCYHVSGPYKGNGDTTLVYEVYRSHNGKPCAQLALCRYQRTAIARAKRERTMAGDSGAPIMVRFPSEDWMIENEV